MQQRYERHRQRLYRELDRMRAYAELHDCRRRYLLEYLGQEAQPCGQCDNCVRGLAQIAHSPDAPFPLNTRVVDRELGKGVVLECTAAKLKILFDSTGEKTLDLAFVLQRELLSRV